PNEKLVAPPASIVAIELSGPIFLHNYSKIDFFNSIGAKQTMRQDSQSMCAISKRWEVGVETTAVSREHVFKLAVRFSFPADHNLGQT
ncbi:MAG: hypothetical protein RL145_71, partial [Pseudomonadota bacterium]